jgi:oligoendopeptidase F
MWHQYKKNPESAINNYVTALDLGGTRTLPELFRAAGLKFDFSPDYISGLMQFVKQEIDKLKKS